MKTITVIAVIITIILSLTFISNFVTADENIYGLKIENINKNGADFYWSTSIETIGSIEYAYTKLAELYNPQLPGSKQDILMTVAATQTMSEKNYTKEHHIKVDDLNLSYNPFVEYTIKSQAFDNTIYTISGEFVLVDTQKIHWWQNWWFPVVTSFIMLIVGIIIKPPISRILKRLHLERGD